MARRKRKDDVLEAGWDAWDRVFDYLVGTKQRKTKRNKTSKKKTTYRPPGAGRRKHGRPRGDIERLKRHFGPDWRNHTVDELPPRGTGLRRRRR